MWHWLAHAWHETWIAVLLAVLFAIVVDLFRIGSTIRRMYMELRISWARMRPTVLYDLIKLLERNRAELMAMKLPFRTAYFTAVRTLVRLLLVLIFGLVANTAADVLPSSRVLWRTAAIVIWFFGSTILSVIWILYDNLMTPEKFAKIIARYDRRIEELKKNLETLMWAEKKRGDSQLPKNVIE